MDEDIPRDDAQEAEWLGQNNLIYGGLIAAGLILVQPFLTADSLDRSAWLCVVAFSVAIPLLAALVVVNHQENFRGRPTPSRIVAIAKGVAQTFAFAGVTAGFWHIHWMAGVGILVGGVLGLTALSAGLSRLDQSP